MKKVNGKFFWQALAYAFRACPDPEKQARLSHIVFIDNRIVGSDATRWQVGILPEDSALKKPMAVARASIDELLLGLQYAWRISQRHNAEFTVKLDGDLAIIDYGEHAIPHKLLISDVGEIPTEWEEPVAPDAPLLRANQAEIHCGNMKDAMTWHRSWNKDFGTFTMRGQGGMNAVRIDITAGGEKVASSFLLPIDRPAAQLPEDGDLFTKGEAVGQSLLSLKLLDKPKEPPASDGAPEPKGKGKKKGKGFNKKAAAEEDAGAE